MSCSTSLSGQHVFYPDSTALLFIPKNPLSWWQLMVASGVTICVCSYCWC